MHSEDESFSFGLSSTEGRKRPAALGGDNVPFFSQPRPTPLQFFYLSKIKKKKTVVITIGPACHDVDTLCDLLNAGATVARCDLTVRKLFSSFFSFLFLASKNGPSSHTPKKKTHSKTSFSSGAPSTSTATRWPTSPRPWPARASSARSCWTQAAG